MVLRAQVVRISRVVGPPLTTKRLSGVPCPRTRPAGDALAKEIEQMGAELNRAFRVQPVAGVGQCRDLRRWK